MSITSSILLSFDLEEFDLPTEYGQNVEFSDQLRVANEGVAPVLRLLEKQNITATFFITANFAQHNKELVKSIAQKHEVASHGFYHSSFELKDLITSKQMLEEIIQKPVVGYRMARLAALDNKEVANAGYQYNSSMNPTFIPGRYNNLKEPRTIHQQNGIYIVPTSVTPRLRIPLFWLSFKNLPFFLIKYWSKMTLQHDKVLSLYYHPHEFAVISGYKIPRYTRAIEGEDLVDRLEKYIVYLKQYGTFTTIQKHLQQHAH